MARIAGVDLPRNKRIVIALTYIHGIGRSTAEKMVEKLGLDETVFPIVFDFASASSP